jgi:hypothetical protein
MKQHIHEALYESANTLARVQNDTATIAAIEVAAQTAVWLL